MRKEAKKEVTLLKKPVVFKQGDSYNLYPVPLIRRGEGKSLIVGAASVVANKHDVKQVIDPEQIAKLSTLWEKAEEARMALELAAGEAFEGAQVFSEDEIEQTSELVTEAMAVRQ